MKRFIKICYFSSVLKTNLQFVAGKRVAVAIPVTSNVQRPDFLPTFCELVRASAMRFAPLNFFFRLEYKVPLTRNQQSTAWNRESKALLDYPMYMGGCDGKSIPHSRSAILWQGHPTSIFRKYLFRRRFKI